MYVNAFKPPLFIKRSHQPELAVLTKSQGGPHHTNKILYTEGILK